MSQLTIYHIFCINRKETKNTFLNKNNVFFQSNFTLLISSLSFTLLIMLLNNMPISLDGPLEGAYVTIGNPAFCLLLYLTGVHFRGELQHGGDVNQQKIKRRPIRTSEIGGVFLSDVLYV